MKKITLIWTFANLLILGIPCSYSQNVGVNNSGSAPDVSALLDVDAAGMTPKKGLLIPRVILTSSTDAATISSPATSLLVYNTGATFAPAGYYYNSGTSGSPVWTQLVTNSSSNPPGSYLPFAGATAPSGYLECNGAAVSRTTYANLFAVIGTMYGVGDGSTTFNLPDMRGEFMRGWAHGTANDPDKATRTNRGDGTAGDNVGTKQADQLKSHTHSLTVNVVSAGVNCDNSCGGVGSAGGSPITGATGGNETRPLNINVLYCIKY